jgi:hypothetical protein
MGFMGKLFGGGDKKKPVKGDSAKRPSGRKTSVRRSAKMPSAPAPDLAGDTLLQPAPSESGKTKPAIGGKVQKKSTAAVRPGVGFGKGGRPSARDSGRKIRKSVSNKQVGSLLVKAGSISNEQLDQALEIQADKDGLLGQILTELGYCSKADVGGALRKQRTITTVLLTNVKFDPEALALLGRDFCLRNRLIPFEKMGNQICVAMANVLDAQAKTDIKDKTQLQVKTFDASWQEIQQAITDHIPETFDNKAAAAAKPDDLVIELPEEEIDIIEEMQDSLATAMNINPASSLSSSEETVEVDFAPPRKQEPLIFDELEVIEELDDSNIAEIAEIEELAEIAPGAEEIVELPEIAPLEEIGELAELEEVVEIAEVAELKEVAEIEELVDIEEIPLPGKPLPDEEMDAIPMAGSFFAEVVQWGAADAERRWLAEHLADNPLSVVPAPDIKAS